MRPIVPAKYGVALSSVVTARAYFTATSVRPNLLISIISQLSCKFATDHFKIPDFKSQRSSYANIPRTFIPSGNSFSRVSGPSFSRNLVLRIGRVYIIIITHSRQHSAAEKLPKTRKMQFLFWI